MDNQTQQENLERVNPSFAKKLGLNPRTTTIVPNAFEMYVKFHNSIGDVFEGYVHRAIIQHTSPLVMNAFRKHKYSYLHAYVLSPVRHGIGKPHRELIGTLQYYIEKGDNPLVHICYITGCHGNIQDYLMHELENIAIRNNIGRIEMDNTSFNYYHYSQEYGFYYDMQEPTNADGRTDHMVKQTIRPHEFTNNFVCLYCDLYGKSYSTYRKKYNLPSNLITFTTSDELQ